MGKYQFKFRNAEKSSISNYAFDCKSHNTLNFYDQISSSRDIDQNGGQFNLTSTIVDCTLGLVLCSSN